MRPHFYLGHHGRRICAASCRSSAGSEVHAQDRATGRQSFPLGLHLCRRIRTCRTVCGFIGCTALSVNTCAESRQLSSSILAAGTMVVPTGQLVCPHSRHESEPGFTTMASISSIGLHGVLISTLSRISGTTSSGASTLITRRRWKNWSTGSESSGRPPISISSLTSAAACLSACNLC